MSEHSVGGTADRQPQQIDDRVAPPRPTVVPVTPELAEQGALALTVTDKAAPSFLRIVVLADAEPRFSRLRLVDDRLQASFLPQLVRGTRESRGYAFDVPLPAAFSAGSPSAGSAVARSASSDSELGNREIHQEAFPATLTITGFGEPRTVSID